LIGAADLQLVFAADDCSYWLKLIVAVAGDGRSVVVAVVVVVGEGCM
jgi:hypothetical protein